MGKMVNEAFGKEKAIEGSVEGIWSVVGGTGGSTSLLLRLGELRGLL
jgi:hypothetical protein